MKKYLQLMFLFLLFGCSSPVEENKNKSQRGYLPPATSDFITEIIIDPKFPGGKGALKEFFKKHLGWWIENVGTSTEDVFADQSNMQEPNVLGLLIDTNGVVVSVDINDSLFNSNKVVSEKCYKEIMQMPKWTPGISNGKRKTMSVLLLVHLKKQK